MVNQWIFLRSIIPTKPIKCSALPFQELSHYNQYSLQIVHTKVPYVVPALNQDTSAFVFEWVYRNLCTLLKANEWDFINIFMIKDRNMFSWT
jgi:hypothetical protein